MAVDTRNKRASCVGLWSPNHLRVWPNPSGAIGALNRQQIAWVYAGILASPFVSRAALNQWFLLWQMGMTLNPFNRYIAITPSDTTDLSLVPAGILTAAIYVGGAGNVNAVMSDGTTCLYSAVPAGTILPISVKRVNASLTTATLMTALYQL